ncbi:hypothetical protein [Paenisporosarcina sp. TG20]|uniref:hypothetical protein n=1 Tax=Paenisporosarcina sp. TG20 TaxID=1211706 RepID=UPI0002E4BE0D|nr:hypothetical protein [Paenisporosarcina sp. TG20]
MSDNKKDDKKNMMRSENAIKNVKFSPNDVSEDKNENTETADSVLTQPRVNTEGL